MHKNCYEIKTSWKVTHFPRYFLFRSNILKNRNKYEGIFKYENRSRKKLITTEKKIFFYQLDREIS